MADSEEIEDSCDELIPIYTAEDKIADLFEEIIIAIGEDPTRSGLIDTPRRMGRAYKEMFCGYQPLPFSMTTFPSESNDMVVRKRIPFTAYCEHHFAPFIGTIDFAYIPNGHIIGISKIIRLFQHLSSRLHVQEELTGLLLDEFCSYLQPKGAAIVIEAFHSCESNRGVRVPNVATITAGIRGIFADDESLKDEFYRLVDR